MLPVEDFSLVEELFPSTGRNTQTPMMAVSRQDFSRAEAFWLFLTKEGVVVGGMGVKFVDLGGECIESYLRRTSRHQYGRSKDPIASVAAPVRDELAGKLIYFGELEFAENSRGHPEVLRSFTRLAQILAAVHWPSFDWMYAFIPDEHFRLAREYGFTWYCPNAITWTDPPPQGRLDSHWIMAASKSHFAHLLSAQRRGLVGRKQR